MKIKLKFYAVILACVFAGMISSACLYWIVLDRDMMQTINKSEEVSAQETASSISERLGLARQALASLSVNTELAALLVDRAGIGWRSDDTLRLWSAIRDTQHILPLAASINIADELGRIILSPSGNYMNVGSEQFFRDAMNGMNAEQYLETGLGDKNNIFVISAPIMSDQNAPKPIGAAFITIDLSPLVRVGMGERYVMYSGHTISLTYNSGEIFYATGIADEYIADSDRRTAQDAIDRCFSDKIEGAFDAGDNILLHSKISAMQWYVAITLPKEAIYRPLYRFRNLSILSFGGVIAIALLLTMILTRGIVPRIQRGVEFAEAVASGDIYASVEDSSKDEIGRLLRAINIMVRNLRSAVSEARTQEARATEFSMELVSQNSRLESMVEERTKNLQQAERHTKFLLDLAMEAMVELDPNGKVTTVNETALKMLQRTESEMLGRDFFGLIGHGSSLQEGGDLATFHLHRAVESRERVELFDVWVASSTGRRIPVSLTSSPMINGDRREGTLVSFTDITNLTRSNMMVQALYQSPDVAHIFLSKDYEVIDCNDAAIKMFGIESKETMKESLLSIFPEYQPDGSLTEEYLERNWVILENDGHVRFECQFRTTAGTPLPCVISITKVTADDEPIYVTTINDITPQKKVQQALTEQREQLQEILDSSPLAMVLSRDTSIIEVNEVASELFGIRKGEDPMHALADPDEMLSAMDDMTSGIDVRSRPIDMYSPTGERLNTQVTIHPFMYEKQPVALTWISDVTELTKARVLAEAAAKAKSDFLASMSHEIRTPMNAIMGMTHLCLQTDVNERQRNYLTKIQRAASSLLNIINDILDFSKIESGKFTFDSAPFLLSEITEGISDMIAFRAEEKGVRFSMSLPKDIPDAYVGDALRLNQILVNLCNNAVKFTEHGEISLKFGVDLGEPDEDGRRPAMLTCSVKDTGIGMTEEQTDKLFQPFTQADGSITRRFGGSGLGLSISKYLAENMGGGIHVDSRFGVGSEFSFDVKLVALSDTEAAELTEQSDDNDVSTMRKISASVLLVEDNEINQEIAVEMLTQFGATVDVADNGQEALDKIPHKHYDMVFMDVQMPVMDGLEATRRIRSSLGLKSSDLPIVAMTAHAMKGDYEKSLDAGMDDHITKPIDPNELYRALAVWSGVTPNE